MRKKTQLPNSGVPLYVNPREDLVAKPETAMDSWYVTCNFEYQGRQIGFEWHQQIGKAQVGKTSQVEFLAMDGTNKIWVDNSQHGEIGEGLEASDQACKVVSRFGELTGTSERLTLRLASERASLNVQMMPQAQTLYNGTTGLLEFMGTDSQEFAFPNMLVDGELVLDGEVIPVKNATAWLDRQWSEAANPVLKKDADSAYAGPSWMWIGMTTGADSKVAISLWDVIANGVRNGFATILDERGVQANHVAEVAYGKIWKSSRTGNSYPATFTVRIPTFDASLEFTALLDEPEFDHGSASVSGCQSICRVTGKLGTRSIDQHVIVELIGDVCGNVEAN